MAYTRRKRFEAKLLAAELAAVLASGMGTMSLGGNGRSNQTSKRGGDHVHADKLLGEMGITF
jgi:hypothetical protein